MRVLVATVCLVLAACGVGGVDGGDVQSGEESQKTDEQAVQEATSASPATTSTVPAEPEEQGTQSIEEPAPSASEPPPDESEPESDSRVEFARADLANRLGTDESKIALVRVDEVEWRDTSLGCPDPKKSYAQVLVDGYDIVFEVGGMEYHYHSGGGRDPFYCAIPTE